VVEAGDKFFIRSVRRVGADFLVPIIVSKVGPAQRGPIVCAKGWGSFYRCAIWKIDSSVREGTIFSTSK
jgi:hypothetical protein